MENILFKVPILYLFLNELCPSGISLEACNRRKPPPPTVSEVTSQHQLLCLDFHSNQLKNSSGGLLLWLAQTAISNPWSFGTIKPGKKSQMWVSCGLNNGSVSKTLNLEVCVQGDRCYFHQSSYIIH